MEKEYLQEGSAPAHQSAFNYPPQHQQPPPYYPQQQQSYYPPQQQQTVIQIVQSPPLPTFGTRSANIQCPFCQTDIETKTKRIPNCSTHMCACMFWMVCLPCCSWIPYCSDSFNDIEHECPNCHKFLGVFARSNARYGRY